MTKVQIELQSALPTGGQSPDDLAQMLDDRLASYDIDVCDCQIHRACETVERKAYEIQQISDTGEILSFRGWCEDPDGRVHWASFEYHETCPECGGDFCGDDLYGDDCGDEEYDRAWCWRCDGQNFGSQLVLTCTCKRENCAHAIALMAAHELGHKPFHNMHSQITYLRLQAFFGPVNDRSETADEGHRAGETTDRGQASHARAESAA